MFTPEPDKESLVEHCQQRIDKLEGERSVVRSRIFQDFQAEEDDRQAKLEDERELAEIAQFRERDPQAAAKYTDVHDRLIAAAQEREARRNGVSAERSGGPDYRMLEKWSRRAADSYQEDYLVAEIGRNKLLIKLHELEAKHEDMKRRYTAALNEKIELLRECASPPHLPVEVLVNVAAFLAGSNCYGSIAALSATSKLMQQECEPVLFETVLWHSDLTGIFRYRKKKVIDLPSTWRHIRFLIIEDRDWAYLAQGRSDAFPKLRASIEKHGNSSTSYYTGPGHRPTFTARLQIYADMTFSTLASLLNYPLDWYVLWEPTIRSRICGIKEITIHNDATFYPNNSRDCAFTPTECGPNYICVEEPCDMGKEPKRTEICVRALAQLAMQGERPRRQLFIQCNWAAQAASWSRQLPQWLKHDPFTTPHIDLHLDEAITVEEFLQYVQGFEAAYKSVWLNAFAQIEVDSDYDTEIFELRALWPDQDDPEQIHEDRYTASFIRWSGWSGFHIEAFQRLLSAERLQDGPGHETMMFLDDRHYLPFGRRLISAGDDVDDASEPGDDDNEIEVHAAQVQSDEQNDPIV